MKLLNFLFGKKPDIFNKRGMVEHQLKGDSWSLWKNRYTHGRDYDWTKHSGIKYTEDTALEQEQDQKKKQYFK